MTLEIGKTYELKTEPEWKVTITEVVQNPMFSDEPLVRVRQMNGGSFFGLSAFEQLFQESESCVDWTNDNYANDYIKHLRNKNRNPRK